MLPTWYPISTLHIPPSPVLSHCPEYAVVFVPCLCAFPTGIFFINFLVYSIYLFSLTLSFHTLFRVSSQNFKLLFILILAFLTHIFNSQKIKFLLNKRKNKTIILIKGGQQSLLLLTFFRAILRPLCVIFTFLLPDYSFQTLFLFHRSPNPLQLGCVFLLVFYQVPERLPYSLVLLHEFLECLFDST